MQYSRLTFGVIWLVVPAALTLLAVWSSTDFPLDFWLHINAAREMVQTGHLVETDTLTFTIAGRPAAHQPWLAQLILYFLFRAGGYALVQFVVGLIYAAGIGLITWTAYARSRNTLATGLAMTACVLMSLSNFGVHPQAFSYLFFSIYLLIFWMHRALPSIIWIVALVQILWANTHGAFPLGVALPLLFLAGEIASRLGARPVEKIAANQKVRVLFGCTIAAFVATVVNPRGVGIVAYVSGVTSKAAQRGVGEWLPNSYQSYTGTVFFLSVAAVLLVVALSRKRFSRTEALLLVGFFLCAAQSQRMVIWWATVAASVMAPHVAEFPLFSRLATQRAEQLTTTHAIILGAMALLVILSTPWSRGLNPLLAASKRAARMRDEPRGAADFLRSANQPTNLFAPMEWSSYFSWHLHPQVRTFVDARIESFPDTVWNDYLHICAASSQAAALLDQYHVDLIAWRHEGKSPLRELLESSGTWKTVYQDHTSVVYQRNK